jgi:hypothetical protein
MKNETRKNPRRFMRFGILGAAALCLVAAAAAILGGEEMDPAIKTQFDAAHAAYQAGKFAEAAGLYEKVDSLMPGNPEVLKQLGDIALLNNRPRDAERFYREALKATPWYANVWPLTSYLKYRMSLAYYRMDRMADAAAAMRESVGPAAIGPLADLDALRRQMMLFAGQAPYSIEGPEESRIEFVITDPLPVVRVSVNGSPPQLFIVDTGGAEIVLDDDLAEAIGAQIGGSLTSPYAGGKTAKTGLGKVDSVAIGDFLVRDVPVHILNTDHWSSDFGMEIKGVVGTRFLMHFLSTIDYSGGSLILRRLCPDTQKSLDERIARQGAKVIPFWLADLHTIVAWGTVNGLEPMLFFVDTGLAGKGFTAPEPILEKAGIPVDWTKAEDAVGGGTEKFKSVDIQVRRLTFGSGPNEVVMVDVP